MSTTSTIIMAGGLGTRMRSPRPKVLHDLCGAPMLAWVEAAAREAGADDVVVVVSPAIADEIGAAFPQVEVAIQSPANGTGHAVEVGLAALGGRAEHVLILSGDTPAIRAETVRAVREAGSSAGVDGALAIAQVAPPHAYGRVIRSGGAVERIVEARDASAEELAIADINVGIYCVRASALEQALSRVGAANAQGERYLTDAIGLLSGTVVAVDEDDVASCEGINSMRELAGLDELLRHRLLDAAMLAGVRIVDPSSTFIDRDVTLAPGSRIEPFCQLRAGTTVAEGAVVGPYVAAHGARIGPRCVVGPFAYLRPGTVLHERASVGRFVELKGAEIGNDSKVPHLSYLGDVTVGERVNIGAGTITANYDGFAKHRTEIADGARTSSNSVLVAPVRIGEGATVAAGSVITEDVPDGALGIARPRQVVKEGYAERVAARREEES
ncbi:MAG: bifunctional UDP-N-acetylglucosamine diphosphorylase/glucosamine-1-phosphate N-acetyltransferase GlmU [Gaiellales bacterium]